MQFTTILSVFTLAMAASAVPNPPSSCNSGQVVACCDQVNKGVGINCLASTLNILNTVCAGGQSVACCTPSNTGGSLINAQCVSVNVL